MVEKGKKRSVKKKLVGARLKPKRNKELYRILSVMIGLILLFLVFYYIFQSLNKFEYKGLTFTKERFGELVVYHHYYYFEDNGEMYKYNLFLREDPRESEVLVEGNRILYPKGKFAYIALDGDGLAKCEKSNMAIASLSAFLSNNMITPKGASIDEDEAKLNNLAYATCESKEDNPVIIIKEGNETRIDIDMQDLCYVISVSNCEVLEAIEEFIVQSIVDAKGY